jgi:hypothetical protein
MSADVVRPDFLVLGAQKCATSWLYYCLREHPELHLPEHKREYEYIGGDLYRERGAEWYFSLLAGRKDTQRAGAVSVDYLTDPRSAPEVRAQLPGVKLIASLREPVSRAMSAYFWYLRKGHVPDVGVARALEQGMQEPGTSATNADRYFRDLITRGFYDEQLARYRALFPPSQVMIVLYEDIARDPLSVLKELFTFLGVDPGFVPPSISTTPKKNTYSRPLIALERLTSLLPDLPRRVFAKGIDAINGWTSGGAPSDRPDIPTDLRQRLRALYRPHQAALQQQIQELPASQRPTGTLQDRWS